MMTLAAIFGSGFAAMNTFFPLQAKSLHLQAGLFFSSYGASLIFVRLFLGALSDRLDRDKLILGCLLAFGLLLVLTSQITLLSQTVFLGLLFGLCQGLSYPAMMAKMVDKSDDSNRAVIVALFTGSFGVGINVSVLAWGIIGDFKGLVFMFVLGGVAMFISAAIFWAGVTLRGNAFQKRGVF
jgi:MFS family permease